MYVVQNLYNIHQLMLTYFCLHFGTEKVPLKFDFLRSKIKEERLGNATTKIIILFCLGLK